MLSRRCCNGDLIVLGLECLAVVIFFEARNQPIDGQYSVAEVVMNRVESDKWPNTICKVAFQPKQFSFTHDGKSDKIESYTGNIEEWYAAQTARSIAKAVYSGDVIGITSTHYHSTKVKPYWIKGLQKDGRIGDHIFYTLPHGK